MNLRPSDIHYSQDSINIFFDKRSSHNGVRIGQTLDDICDGRCRVESIPTISVMNKNNKWVTADNRRLWVFRQLERLGKVDTINVRKTHYIPATKMTSLNGGTSVEVRGVPGGRWYKKPSVSKPKVASSHSHTAKASPVVKIKHPSTSNIGSNHFATYKTTTTSNDNGSFTHHDAFNDLQRSRVHGVCSTRRVCDASATGSAGRASKYAVQSRSSTETSSYQQPTYVHQDINCISHHEGTRDFGDKACCVIL